MTRLERLKNLDTINGFSQKSYSHMQLEMNDFKWLISRVEKLEAALKFYADQEPTHKLPFSEGDTDPEKLNAPLIPLPLGVARAALSDSDEEMK